MREKVLGVFLESALLVDDRAVGYLLQQADPVASALRVTRAMSALPEPPLVVGMVDVANVIDARPRPDAAPIVVMPATGQGSIAPARLPVDLPGARARARPSVPEAAVRPQAAPRAQVAPVGRGTGGGGGNGGKGSCMEVLTDITGNSTCSGCASDFARYFQDRFARLRRLIINRQEMAGAVPIAAVQHSNGGPVKTLGMVSDRQSTSKGGVVFGLEDQSGTVKVLCSPDRVPTDIVTDEVVGVVGALSKDRGIIYAESIVRPDIPLRRSGHRADRDLHVAFASDMHVGSATFLDAQWDRFMDFLNGRLETSNGILDTLEYLIIPGDLVDGIGVFPNQRDELLIPDIYRQYEALSELLKDVPDRIQVVLMPGNHDMVRQAEPQPALPKEIQGHFSGRVTFLGNPAMLSIEGVRILAYHGRSIDDYVTAVQACTYEQPLVTMKEMLRRRHLAPVYGGRTPIAPEASDHLVVETIPDVFVTGHVHGAGAEAYRGSLLINASAWQSQTKYQKSMNFTPDPAKVPIVNLRDMSVKFMDFAS